MNHVRLHAPATADLRSTPRMLQLGGPFDAVAHTAEMRRPEGGSGRYNIPNVGIFLWRLQPFRLSDVPLTPIRATRRAAVPLQPARRRPAAVPPAGDRDGDLAHRRAGQRARRRSTCALMALAVQGRRRPTPTVARRLRRGRELRAVAARTPIPAQAAGRRSPSATICVCDLRDVRRRLGARGDARPPTRSRSTRGSAACCSGSERQPGPILGDASTAASRGRSAAANTSAARPGERSRRSAARSGGEAAAAAPRRDRRRRAARHRRQPDLRARRRSFKVDGVTAPGAPGLEVVVAARNGARPLIAAGGPSRSTSARAAGWCSTAWSSAAARCSWPPPATTSRASWSCATARWCRASR